MKVFPSPPFFGPPLFHRELGFPDRAIAVLFWSGMFYLLLRWFKEIKIQRNFVRGDLYFLCLIAVLCSCFAAMENGSAQRFLDYFLFFMLP